MTDDATPSNAPAEPEPRTPVFRLTHWNETSSSVAEFASIEQARDALESSKGFAWLDIECVPLATLEPVLEQLVALHPIAADALCDDLARVRVQNFGAQLLTTMVFIHATKGGKQVAEVIDFLATPQVLVTIQDLKGDCFDSVREQLRDPSARVRKLGPYFLLLQLGRSIAKSYDPLFKAWSERVNKLEDSLTHRADRRMLQKIHFVRDHMMTYRECVIPLRESLRRLLAQPQSQQLPLEASFSLQELEDEFAVLQERLNNQTDRVQRLMDLYLNAIANRANEVMRVLTIISTIFMPLSFVASLYGMNFQRDDGANPWNMPELYWKYGYLFALGLMFCVSLAFLCFFWKRGWIGAFSRAERKQGLDSLTQELAGVIGLSNLTKGRPTRIARPTQAPMIRQR